MNFKFKVWYNGEMYQRWDSKGNILIRNGGYVILEQPSPLPLFSGELIGFEGAIVRLFTGLQDKNYQEIYNGDVMQSDLPYENSEEYSLVVVQWNDEMACFELKSINGQHGTTPINWYKRYTIIGNLYENPELVKIK